MSSASKDNFTYSFPIWMPFLSSSCLIALAGTSSTMLSRSGEGGHACLVPDLRGKAFSEYTRMLAAGLSYGLYQAEEISSIPTLLRGVSLS